MEGEKSLDHNSSGAFIFDQEKVPCQTEATRSTIECPDSTAPVSLQGHALVLPSNGRCYRTTMDPFAQSSSLHFS